MKRNPYYALEMINGIPYLLPFGQNIAEQKASFQLNETGVFLWNHLDEAETERQLLDILLNDESPDSGETAGTRRELADFINMLVRAQVILRDEDTEYQRGSSVKIAGITVTFSGLDYAVPKTFDAFRTFSPSETDLSVAIITGTGGVESGERIVIHSKELNVYERNDRWHLDFPAFDNIAAAYINKELTDAKILVRYEDEKSRLRENVFHVLRHLFLLKAQSFGLFAMHSASVLYRGQAYLFSGSGGAGKGTFARLWNETFGTEVLNGDLNLLSDEGVVCGIPWCGTSGRYTAKDYPLGGIIFLKQAEQDHAELLEGHHKSLRIAQRLISPAYSQEQLEENIGFAVNLAKRIPCWRLQCTMNRSSAEIMRDAIDRIRNRSLL